MHSVTGSRHGDEKCEIAERERFEVGVIGSGFGGSIAAIELAKAFKGSSKKVCILERGVWNTSPEAWTPENKVAEFIDKGDRPYQFWAQPDTSRGLLNLLGMLRTIPYVTGFLKLFGKNKINYRGLYDMKNYDEIFSLVASGVGGGSLVYSGVISCPEPEILDDPYTGGGSESNSVWKPRWSIRYHELEKYMMYAKYKFIGVNKIYSIESGHPDDEWMVLPKTKTMRNAVRSMKEDKTSESAKRLSELDIEFGGFEFADLAMKEAPEPKPRKKTSAQADPSDDKTDEPKGFCKRQGRCNMGCLPGARNTLNKKLVDAINDDLDISIQELAEVIRIEPIPGKEGGYCITYLNHGINPEDQWRNFRGRRIYYRGLRIYRKKRIIEGKLCRMHVNKLILAAGTYGTTGLLLRSKQELGNVWDFSDKVGKCFSLNGDDFGFVTQTDKPAYPTVGPIDTTKVRFKKNGKHYFTIEDATIPRMIAGTFASLIEAHLKILKENRTGHITKTFFRYPRLVIEFLIRDHNDIGRFIRVMKKFIESSGWFPANEGLHGWLMGVDRHRKREKSVRSRPGKFSDQELDEIDDAYRVSRVFFFACMGVDRADAKASWNSRTEELQMNWGNLAGEDDVYKDIQAGMSILSDHMVSPDTRKLPPGEYKILEPMEQLFGLKNKKKLSIHPVGGCPMDTEGRPGAVSCAGKLKKNDGSTYENLYIVDGSVIPTALGVNPSLTISGLAFRIVDEIIRADYRTIPRLKSVETGKTYPVTIREFSKAPNLGLAVATVDPENNPKDPDHPIIYDNIVYVKEPDPNNLVCKTDDLDTLPKPIKVLLKIDEVDGRFAFGSLVDQAAKAQRHVKDL